MRILARYIRLHADYFVRARSNLDDTYLVLGLDPRNPDLDRLHEISWQAEKANRETPPAEPAIDGHGGTAAPKARPARAISRPK